MKTCFETTIAGFNIQLQQYKNKSFRVVYGKQIDDNLNYYQATTKLGEAIFHALACDSRLENDSI